MKLSRRIADPSGKVMQVEEILEISVKPGWKSGTKVTFPEKGDESLDGRKPADVQFLVQEVPHAVFTRDGNDLTCTRSLTLKEALCGTVVEIKHLDDHILRFTLEGPVNHSQSKVIQYAPSHSVSTFSAMNRICLSHFDPYHIAVTCLTAFQPSLEFTYYSHAGGSFYMIY